MAGLSGYMVSSKDRVGWFARSGRLYFEVTFEGKVARFSGVASPGERIAVNAVALTDDNRVFADIVDPHKGSELYRLDRTSGTWVRTAAPHGTTLALPSGATSEPELFAGDGNRFAFLGYNLENLELEFFVVTAQR